MLNKRSQIYEIQKRVTGGQHQQSRGSNKPDNKMASAASVHSDSFNYSTSTGATSKKPSSNSRQTESHNQAVRKSKQPRMGVPMMTSTPRGQMKSSSSSGKYLYHSYYIVVKVSQASPYQIITLLQNLELQFERTRLRPFSKEILWILNIP